EYTGLLKALEWLIAHKIKDEVIVRGDSDLVIKQVNGEYKVKSALLAPLHGRVKELAGDLPNVRFEWIQRERNADADLLTNLAYAEYTGQSMKAPTTSVMTVDIVIASPPEVVRKALHQAGLKGTVTPVPGASRVQVDLPAQPDAIRPLIELKRRLEGSL
ncbi:MAG TPA: ribonuclease HI family protein, partial [Planctomycetota bacterium]|nr:ribonuclease HI family protein [Planctomycetota bacterium]